MSIHDVTVTPLRRIPDERGAVLHMLRADAEHFQGFGEIYFSLAYPGAIKAWHRHREMTLNYAVPMGMIKLVLYDDRPGSPSLGEVQELHIGALEYALVTIPPLIWNGFTAEGGEPALVANCATIPHDLQEIERLDPLGGAIPYSWALRHG